MRNEKCGTTVIGPQVRLRDRSLVIALLYSLCIHTIGLSICVRNFLSDLVTACNKSLQKTRVTNLSKALQDNMHEMIDKNNENNTK